MAAFDDISDVAAIKIDAKSGHAGIADIKRRGHSSSMTERWTRVTKEEVERAVAVEREQTDTAYWALRANLLVDPYPVVIERFGGFERVFVVAKSPPRVVFFDDIEEVFGTAAEEAGRLNDCANYGALAVALKEAAEQR